MLQRGQVTTFEVRLAMTERAAAGQSDPEIAAALGCSIWTVRKWRRVGQRRGRLGLTSRMGRPATGPVSTSPPALRDTILQLRRTHPGWGPATLRAELQLDPRWADQPLPSRSRIAALLKAAKLTRRYQRHSDLPAPAAQPADAPHDEWELDAQGAMQVDGVGTVSLITILDVTSRLKVESYPCTGRTKPALPDYQLALRRAFVTYGLPLRLTLDRDTVFFDSTTPSPFPTRLHLWLIALGIAVSFTRVRQPTDHAKIERTHQTMTLQALLGQHWPNQTALWAGLDTRRTMLNQHIPCRALHGRVPLEAYPEARHSGRSYYPEWEVDLLDLERVYHYLVTCRWFRHVKQYGVFALGGSLYNVSTAFGGRTIEITFDAGHRAFLGRPEGSEQIVELSPRGLTKAKLMGELSGYVTLPAYQLAFPFSQVAWRELTYAGMLAGMT